MRRPCRGGRHPARRRAWGKLAIHEYKHRSEGDPGDSGAAVVVSRAGASRYARACVGGGGRCWGRWRGARGLPHARPPAHVHPRTSARARPPTHVLSRDRDRDGGPGACTDDDAVDGGLGRTTLQHRMVAERPGEERASGAVREAPPAVPGGIWRATPAPSQAHRQMLTVRFSVTNQA